MPRAARPPVPCAVIFRRCRIWGGERARFRRGRLLQVLPGASIAPGHTAAGGPGGQVDELTTEGWSISIYAAAAKRFLVGNARSVHTPVHVYDTIRYEFVYMRATKYVVGTYGGMAALSFSIRRWCSYLHLWCRNICRLFAFCATRRPGRTDTTVGGQGCFLCFGVCSL